MTQEAILAITDLFLCLLHFLKYWKNYKQLSEYFLYNNLFYSNQYGFRPGHSTELAVQHAVGLATCIKDLEKDYPFRHLY